MRVQVALDDVDVADGVEQARARRGLDLVEGRGDDVAERAALDPAGDAARVVRRVDPVVDRADREVVGVAREVVADVRLPGAVVGQLDTEADQDALRPPALGRAADDPLAVLERRVAEGRRPRLEVDVVRDRDLGDAALERRRRRRRRSGPRCPATGPCAGGRRAGGPAPDGQSSVRRVRGASAARRGARAGRRSAGRSNQAESSRALGRAARGAARGARGVRARAASSRTAAQHRRGAAARARRKAICGSFEPSGIIACARSDRRGGAAGAALGAPRGAAARARGRARLEPAALRAPRARGRAASRR